MPTGRPSFFRCAKCRKAEGATRSEHPTVRKAGWKWTLTGRKRAKRTGSTRRWAHAAYEYLCLSCGHVGWSRHPDCYALAQDP